MLSAVIIASLWAAQTNGDGLSVRHAIELDSTNRSVCEVGENGKKVTLNLEGLRWKKWEDFCDNLKSYLRVDKEPITTATPTTAERLLAETGFFEAITCTATVATSELSCYMSPEPMVREVEIDGDLPFVMLEEDLRRQIFLRPGVVIREEDGTITKQEDRLRNYLQRHGFFDSDVRIQLKEGSSGAQPNAPREVDALVDAGPSVTIRDIQVTGATPDVQDDIEDRLRRYWVFNIFPRRFQPDMFEEDLDEMTRRLQKDGYPEARVSGKYDLDLPNKKVDLKLEVNAGPKLILKFAGNQALDAEDLEEATTFLESGSLDAVEVERSAEKIKEEYQKDGYYAVKITPEVKDQGSREITFKIEEGPRAKVTSVIVRGVEGLPLEEVEAAANLKTNTGGAFSSGRWVDSRVKRDIGAIKSAYRLRGFAVTTVDVGRKILPDKNLEVLFDVREGPRRKVAQVLFKGVPPEIKAEDLKKRMRLIEGAPFVEGRLVSDRREVLTVLAASGYPRAVVSRKLKVPYKTEAGDAYFEYAIEAGERAHFGGFLVRGAFRTRESVIADELSLSPGEPLDLLALSEAKQRLRALGVFTSVDLKPLDQENAGKETWLLVEVTERDNRTLDGVFSFSTDDGLALGADFRDQNFIGRAIHLQLSARLSNASQVLIDQHIGRRDSLSANIQAPHPLGLPFNAEYRAFYDYEDKTTTLPDATLDGFTLRRVGAGAAISRPLITLDMCSFCPELTGRLGYELASVEGIDWAETPSAALTNTPNVTIARIVPSLMARRLDSPVDPRAGYGADLRFEVAHSALAGPLNGGANFWRFMSSVEGYLTLGKPGETELSEAVTVGGPLVVAQNLAYSLGHPYGGTHELPLTETFYYGGDLSVRGISERASWDSLRLANYLFRGTTELRYYFLQTSIGSFQLAALSDYGMVSRHLADLFSQPTISAGGAFRYITPVGPVSLAYAVPILKADGISDNGRLHISFGYSF